MLLTVAIQGLKLMDQLTDTFVGEMVDIDLMQFGFLPGLGTTDATFIIRQLQEKYIVSKLNIPQYSEQTFVMKAKACIYIKGVNSPLDPPCSSVCFLENPLINNDNIDFSPFIT